MPLPPPGSGSGAGAGSGSGSDNAPANAKAKMQNADTPKDTALEKLLTEKMLPEKKTEKVTTGLLYFALEKVNRKNRRVAAVPAAQSEGPIF